MGFFSDLKDAYNAGAEAVKTGVTAMKVVVGVANLFDVDTLKQTQAYLQTTLDTMQRSLPPEANAGDRAVAVAVMNVLQSVNTALKRDDAESFQQLKVTSLLPSATALVKMAKNGFREVSVAVQLDVGQKLCTNLHKDINSILTTLTGNMGALSQNESVDPLIRSMAVAIENISKVAQQLLAFNSGQMPAADRNNIITEAEYQNIGAEADQQIGNDQDLKQKAQVNKMLIDRIGAYLGMTAGMYKTLLQQSNPQKAEVARQLRLLIDNLLVPVLNQFNLPEDADVPLDAQARQQASEDTKFLVTFLHSDFSKYVSVEKSRLDKVERIANAQHTALATAAAPAALSSSAANVSAVAAAAAAVTVADAPPVALSASSSSSSSVSPRSAGSSAGENRFDNLAAFRDKIFEDILSFRAFSDVDKKFAWIKNAVIVDGVADTNLLKKEIETGKTIIDLVNDKYGDRAGPLVFALKKIEGEIDASLAPPPAAEEEVPPPAAEEEVPPPAAEEVPSASAKEPMSSIKFGLIAAAIAAGVTLAVASAIMFPLLLPTIGPLFTPLAVVSAAAVIAVSVGVFSAIGHKIWKSFRGGAAVEQPAAAAAPTSSFSDTAVTGARNVQGSILNRQRSPSVIISDVSSSSTSAASGDTPAATGDSPAATDTSHSHQP